MKKWIILASFLAALAYSQAVVFTPKVDYLFLGAQWVQVPKFPGDVGVISLSFYLADQYVDVSISLSPQCPYLTALGSAQMPTAGPGVVTATLKVMATALNATCPTNVYLKATYKASGSTLTNGIEKLEYTSVYIPPYPTAQVYTEGAAYVGLPSTVKLVVVSPYLLTGAVSVQGQGARVVAPTGPVVVNSTRAEIPVTLIADSYTAALTIVINSRDWLGNPVTLMYTVPISAAPPPPAVVSISPTMLSANKYNTVNITVALPIRANGTATVTVAGGIMPQSAVTFPIVNGVGKATVSVYPTASVVTFNVVATYQAAGVARTEQVAASAAVQQTFGGLSRLQVAPSKLIAGIANNVTLAVQAPGPFNVSVTVSGAASDKPSPYYFGGVDKATANLLLTPLSTQPVSLTVYVYHSAGVDQYVVNLPVASSSIFTVLPTPSVVKSGGNRTVTITVINSGDVAIQKAVVAVSPASPSVVASTYTYQLGRLAPLDSAQLPISFIVPATFSGAIAFTYTITYTTELGTSATTQGTFYIQALQTPAVNITTVNVVPATPEPRRTFYVSITIVNKGFSPVSNLQVEARAPPGIRPITSPIYFVGILDTQQTTNVPFSFNATRPGTYEIDFTISYTDQYGNIYTIPYKVTVTVSNSTTRFFPGGTAPPGARQQQQQRQNLPLATIAVAVVAVVVVAAGLVVYRRRHRKTQ